MRELTICVCTVNLSASTAVLTVRLETIGYILVLMALESEIAQMIKIAMQKHSAAKEEQGA